MKIICKWVFLENKIILKYKIKTGIEKMNNNEITDLITDLLAKDETVRVIFERNENENNNKLQY